MCDLLVQNTKQWFRKNSQGVLHRSSSGTRGRKNGFKVNLLEGGQVSGSDSNTELLLPSGVTVNNLILVSAFQTGARSTAPARLRAQPLHCAGRDPREELPSHLKGEQAPVNVSPQPHGALGPARI